MVAGPPLEGRDPAAAPDGHRAVVDAEDPPAEDGAAGAAEVRVVLQREEVRARAVGAEQPGQELHGGHGPPARLQGARGLGRRLGLEPVERAEERDVGDGPDVVVAGLEVRDQVGHLGDQAL